MSNSINVNRRFFIYFMPLMLLILLSGCSCRPDRSYRPVVRYHHPSKAALSHMLAETKGDSYCYAAHGPNQFDCSGLVYYCYGSMNLWLPRRSSDQARVGATVPPSQLQYGDLVFFDTRRHYRGRVNHVGIYTGNGRFIHASSSKRGVISSSFYKPFYHNRIVVCKRVIPLKRVQR